MGRTKKKKKKKKQERGGWLLSILCPLSKEGEEGRDHRKNWGTHAIKKKKNVHGRDGKIKHRGRGEGNVILDPSQKKKEPKCESKESETGVDSG